MYVIHIGPSLLPIGYRFGGAIERRMVELAAAQVCLGMKAVIYSSSDDSWTESLRGVEIRHLRCRFREPLKRFEYLAGTLRDLGKRRENPDIFHFHSVPEGSAFVSRRKSKTFLSYDNYMFRRGRKTPFYFYYRKLLKEFSGLLPVSRYCMEGSREYWGLNQGSMHIVYNGVNLDQFTPNLSAGQALKSELGIGSDKTILYVGRVCAQKGTDLLVKSYRILRSLHRNVQLIVVGPPEQFGQAGRTMLTDQISEAGGLYLGAIAEEKLAAVYNAADIFVMPTRNFEMFGMAAAEAQACGKPVVCSRHGGLIEVISEESGLFFPVGDVEGLVDTLTILITDDERRLQMGEAARRNAQQFGWLRIAEGLKGIYQSC